MPPPAPVSGWGHQRQVIEAQALGVMAEDSTSNAETQMRPGAIAELAVGAWGESEFGWKFGFSNSDGASGIWADTWGKTLSVPRNIGEADANYSRRTLAEVTRPTTTNYGLGLAIDEMLGISGTLVVDAVDWFVSYRYNDGRRMNSGIRLAPFGGSATLDCAFAVVLPEDCPTGHSEPEIYGLANRRRAAGTRIVAVVVDNSMLSIGAPRYVSVTQPYQAQVRYPASGASYTWTATGGTIASGQGTAAATIQPSGLGDIVAHVAESGGIRVGQRTTHAVTAASEIMNVGATEAPAGDSGLTAWVDPQDGATYVWTLTNASILTGDGTNRVALALGEADAASGASASISCTTTNGANGIASVASAQVHILPFPHTYTYPTESIPPGVSSLFSLDLGKAWLVKSIATNGPARVRIYASDAQRLADASRAAGVAPTGDHGLLCEAVTTMTDLAVTFHPWAFGSTPANAAYVAVTNTGTVATPITLTLTTQKNEA